MRQLIYLFIVSLFVLPLAQTFATSEQPGPQNSNSGQYGDNHFKLGKKPANLFYQIPFFAGGDIGQYTTTMAQSRDSVRNMFWDELMSEVQSLAEQGAVVEAMIEPMANILMKFDQLHDIHKAKDVINIDYSLEHQFIAALDLQFSRFDVRDNQRKIQISRGTDADLLAAFIRNISAGKAFGSPISKDEINVKRALELFEQIDYISYGTFSSLGEGNFQLTFHIVGNKNGVTRNFISRGPLVSALDDLAKQVFDYFQANVYEEWKAPYSNLTWLPMPINTERQDQIENPNSLDLYTFNEAKSYCQARGYRLPYAKELLMAETGTQYHEGGIASLYPYAKWAVADHRELNENSWIVPANGGASNGIFTGDGSVPMKGVFWCVRGNVANDVQTIDKIWSLERKYIHKNLDIFTALQTLRFELGDYGAESSKLLNWYGYDFITIDILDSVDEALDVLQKYGIEIDWSSRSSLRKK